MLKWVDNPNIEIIAECINPIVSGWVNYFGKYNASAREHEIGWEM